MKRSTPVLVTSLAIVIASPLRADVSMVAANGFRAPAKTSRPLAVRADKPGDKSHVGNSPTATGSIQLIDNAGLRYFINTNITFSTSSSASAGMSEASFTHAVAATTLNGGTVAATLNDAYDGYNTMCLSLNNTVASCQTGNANFVIYNRNGAAPTGECTGGTSGVSRQYVFPVQNVASLNVQMWRKVFVPDNDTFARWLNYFKNNGASPVTLTMVVANNLGSDGNTVTVTTSSGDATATTADQWVTTFQNYSGTTSSDPRLMHVLQGAGTVIAPLAGVHFADGDDNPYWGYTFTVQPGATAIIMNFGGGFPSKAAAAAKAAAVDALPANALQCMATAETAAVLNFAVPTDVSITKTTAATTVNPGQSVAFTLTATNAATGPASGVTVSDTLPAGMTYASSSCGGSFAAGTFTWNVGAMNPGASASCTLNVTMGSSPTGLISNTATITQTGTDPNPANDSSTASVTLVAQADVSITKTTATSNAAFGQPISYLLTASNAGPAGATGVVVSDTLPAGLTYSSNSCGASFASGTLTWNVGTLAAGGSATCTVVATVGAPGVVANTATITASNADPNSANNTSTARIVAAGPAQVPTLGHAGLAALALALAAFGFAALRKLS